MFAYWFHCFLSCYLLLVAVEELLCWGDLCVSLTWSICLCSQPISSTWYDYWGADYGTYGYNPYIGGVGIPVAKPPVAAEKPGSQGLSVSVSQGEWRPGSYSLLEIVQHAHFLFQ